MRSRLLAKPKNTIRLMLKTVVIKRVITTVFYAYILNGFQKIVLFLSIDIRNRLIVIRHM